jgi:hypothetical protein
MTASLGVIVNEYGYIDRRNTNSVIVTVSTNNVRLNQQIEVSGIHSKWLSLYEILYLNFHLIILRHSVDLCKITSTVPNIVSRISVYTGCGRNNSHI